jgi:hypothetical protein
MTRPAGPMVTAIEALLRQVPPAVATGPEAQLALLLAARVDVASIDRVASLAKELRAALDDLREAVARVGDRGDAVDEIREQRERRRRAAAEAAGHA